MSGRIREAQIRIAIALLALAGMGVTSYLLAVRLTDARIACSTGGCETVQSSPYAEVLGVPVAAVGLAGFALVLVTALLRGEPARAAGVALALGALGFSAYLLVVQLVVIEAVCDWCLATDVTVTGLAALTLLRARCGKPAADAADKPTEICGGRTKALRAAPPSVLATSRTRRS
jgi:uncharacterized membrane protein